MNRRLLVWLCCICAIAAAGAVQPVPVCAAELTVSGGDAVSGNDAALTVSGGDAWIMPYTAYDAYYGSISTTYLEYMRGYLSKLSPQSHYVAARVSQYEYIFAYGEDLAYTGTVFAGAATVVRWSTYNNGSFTSGYDGSFELDPGNYLVYSDLTDKYPALATSSDFTLRQILILFTIFSIGLTIHSMYQVRKVRRVRKEGKT